MPTALSRRELLSAAAGVVLVPRSAAAQELDVPYVPTPEPLVERMLDLVRLAPQDYLIDLGCGDGRIAIAAARRGARALGVDIDPARIEQAVTAARLAGLEGRARFRRQDLFRTPIYEASVIALYLLPRINLELRPRLLTELRPGARIVSHAFHMGDWRPEAEEQLDGRRIFLWIVPAIAGGSWALTDSDGTVMSLELEQRFQEVTGTLTAPGRVMNLQDVTLRGTSFAFTVQGAAGRRTYRGRIEDAEIVPADGEPAWRARRVS